MDAPYKAGFIAILGRPNAGKSTLLNALLRTHLSIVSSKPQTTRHKVLGILEGEGFQACLLDTPGLIRDPKDPLQSALSKTARMAVQQDADLVILLVNPELPEADELEEMAALAGGGMPVILAINKVDLPSAAPRLDAVEAAYRQALKPAATLRISALKRIGLEQLQAEMLQRLPESPPFYEPGQLSDRWERFFAAEIIRGEVFELFSEEIPHSTAVTIELYKEHKGYDEVGAILYVERDGQKGILIGKGGRELRRLIERSTTKIEQLTGRAVRLDLWIKVRHNWRKDPKALKEFGYLGT